MGANEWIERRALSVMLRFAAWSAVWEPKRRVRFPGNPRRMPNYPGQKTRRHRPFVRRALILPETAKIPLSLPPGHTVSSLYTGNIAIQVMKRGVF